MKNYVQEGKVLNVANGTGATVTGGSGILVGALIGIAVNDIAAGESGEARIAGVFSHAKNTGAGTGGAQGAIAYWDDAADKFTAVATDNTAVGKFAATCADGDATCEVLLNV